MAIDHTERVHVRAAVFQTVSPCRDATRSHTAPLRARDEMQLGAGSEQDNHVVSVKPRGGGSEFTLVHVTTGRG